MFQEPSTPSPTPLSPSRLKTLEETLSKQREAHGEPPPSPSGDFLGAHKSPFRKARRHFKNFVGGNVKPPRHTSQIIVSSSLSFIFIFYFCFFVSSNSVFLEIWRFMKDLNGKIDLSRYIPSWNFIEIQVIQWFFLFIICYRKSKRQGSWNHSCISHRDIIIWRMDRMHAILVPICILFLYCLKFLIPPCINVSENWTGSLYWEISFLYIIMSHFYLLN